MNMPFPDALTSSIRYWERGRVFYNAAMAAVVAGIYAWYLPGSKTAVSLDLLQALFVLAVLSNVLYCAAYPVDLLVQWSGYRAIGARCRWILLAVGTLLACVLAEFIARGMFGQSM